MNLKFQFWLEQLEIKSKWIVNKIWLLENIETLKLNKTTTRVMKNQ